MQLAKSVMCKCMYAAIKSQDRATYIYKPTTKCQKRTTKTRLVGCKKNLKLLSIIIGLALAG